MMTTAISFRRKNVMTGSLEGCVSRSDGTETRWTQEHHPPESFPEVSFAIAVRLTAFTCCRPCIHSHSAFFCHCVSKPSSFRTVFSPSGVLRGVQHATCSVTSASVRSSIMRQERSPACGPSTILASGSHEEVWRTGTARGRYG